MNADQLEETTVSKENRILKQITVQDMAFVEKVVQSLMGDSVAARRDFIVENALKANSEI